MTFPFRTFCLRMSLNHSNACTSSPGFGNLGWGGFLTIPLTSKQKVRIEGLVLYKLHSSIESRGSKILFLSSLSFSSSDGGFPETPVKFVSLSFVRKYSSFW